MRNNAIVIITVLVVGVGAFYGGMLYGQQSVTITPQAIQNLPQAERQQLFQSLRGVGGGGRGGQQNNGGFVSGEVIAKDEQSITVKTNDGNTRIVFYSSSTGVVKPSPASIGDVAVGNSVLANGTSNPDGSVIAQSIQVRESRQGGSPNR